MKSVQRLLASCAFASCAILLVSGTGAPTGQIIGHAASRGVHTASVNTPAEVTVPQVDQTDQAFQSFHAALSEAMVQEVNHVPNVSWTAGLNDYFEAKSYEFLKASCGLKVDAFRLGAATASQAAQDLPVYPVPPTPRTTVHLPKEFDGRVRWGAVCPSLNDIRDQAGCGSCWAVAAAEAMTDRHCIASGGAKQPYLSAHDILTCCGHEECGSCQGGYPINAWQFWVNTGVVTGGGFGSVGTCQPYQWAPCEHHTTGTRPQCVAQDDTPACSKSCTNSLNFNGDKSFGSSAYKVIANEAMIMQEIMTYGPVEAGFMVYEDFPHYKSGVYRHVTGSMVGGHAVKLIGWGVEAGEKYWLAANSWNTNWGDQGYFKIARGDNECMIEEMIFAGRV